MVEVRKKTWRAAPMCNLWTVWKERNSVVFDDAVFSIQRMKNSFIYNLWYWSRVHSEVYTCSLVSFIELLVRSGNTIFNLFLSPSCG